MTNIFFFSWRDSPLGGLGLLLIHEDFCGFEITHNNTTQSVGLLWMSDQLVAETSTWQHTTLTTDRHPGGIRTHDLSSRAAVDLRLTTGIGGITNINSHSCCIISAVCKYQITLTLRLLMSHIYGAPSKARHANVVYIWTYVWQRWNSLFLFAAQCFNTESMQRVFLCHICV